LQCANPPAPLAWNRQERFSCVMSLNAGSMAGRTSES
jgi:hypothetical protein